MPSKRLKGSFWPQIRERMRRKAIELYMRDHPETENKPEIAELEEAGYMRMAKILVLRESRLQDKP
jgi:hypothetical protein